MTRPVGFVERMVHVADVAWGRLPDQRYWVRWNEDGEPQMATFRTALSAENYARWLDTTGSQPTVKDVRDAEKALKELEKDVKAVEEQEAIESLEDLERVVLSLPPDDRARSSRKTRVGRHVRRYR